MSEYDFAYKKAVDIETAASIDGSADYLYGYDTSAQKPVKILADNALTGLDIEATADEIDQRNDDSAMTETITGAGALSTTVAVSDLQLAGAGAVTLAVPTKPGFVKVIKQTADNGNVTLALTNVVGQSSGTTATFGDVGDTLVLVSDLVSGKWIVLAEVGVALA